MRKQRLVVVVLLWLVTSLGGGCSWILMRQPEDGYSPETAMAPPDCTPNLGPAIGDTWDTIAVGAGLVGVGTISLATSWDAFFVSDSPAVGVAEIVGGAGLGAMFGASAGHGYATARRCRRLRDEFQEATRKRLREVR